MIDTPRIAITSSYNQVLGHLDNSVSKAIHYYDELLHTYLKGSAYTFEFKTLTNESSSQYLAEGNRLNFRYNDRDYSLQIKEVEKDRTEINVTAYGLSLELCNEKLNDYKGESMSFTDYIDKWNFEKTFDIGVNEVSDKRISHEWTGDETVLARLYSLATVFDAELEFVDELNSDYTFKRTVLNIYRANSDSNHGLGQDRTAEVLRYPNSIHSITKTSDITDLYTAIAPTGKDGLTLSSLNGREEKDSNGNVEYRCDGYHILAPMARDRFPSITLNDRTNDMYTNVYWSYETDNVEMLYGQALAKLKEDCQPKVSYEVDAQIDGNIGDTFTIEDTEYTPTLYLQARITEQEICFTNPSNSKTTFDNFKEVESQIDAELLTQMNELKKQTAEAEAKAKEAQAQANEAQIQAQEAQKEADKVKSETSDAINQSKTDTTNQIQSAIDGITTDMNDNYVKNDTFNSYQDNVSTKFDQTSTELKDTINQTASNLQSEIDEVTTVAESVTKFMNFGDSGLEIGKKDSNIKTVFDNDSWEIVDKGQQVVLVENQTWNSSKGKFSTELRIGNFAFIQGADGSLDFKKVGD